MASFQLAQLYGERKPITLVSFIISLYDILYSHNVCAHAHA